MIVAELFADLKTKNIICWGSGKHFKNLTLPFLKSSGLIENLQGFVENSGETSTFAGITYENISVKELRRPNGMCKALSFLFLQWATRKYFPRFMWILN